MNPGRYFMPNMAGMGMRAAPMMGSVMGNAPVMAAGGRGVGLFGRIGSALRSFNFSGLLSGANKTLNVVNQTIPLIRQAKPMVNNMKSMFKLAKAFGSETVSKRENNNNNNNNNSVNNSRGNITNSKNAIDTNKIVAEKSTVKDANNNYPNFFI